MRKFFAIALVLAMFVGVFAGCGVVSTSKNLEGTLEEIMAKVNEGVENIEYYTTMPVEKEAYPYDLYIDYVEGSEAIYSGPMMSSIPYCSYLIRMPSAEKAKAAAETINANADRMKWICVEAEKVAVMQYGDVVFFAMADEASVDTMVANFTALTK